MVGLELKVEEENRLKNKEAKISVLMVTGVYFPEINGAVLQCKAIISLLKKNVNFRVLSATKDKDMLNNILVDGVSVYRAKIQKNNFFNLSQIFSISFYFLKNRKEFDLVHIHGFSKKSALVIILSKLFGKKIILKLTSFGHDDPVTVYSINKKLFIFYRFIDVFIGVSPIFEMSYSRANLTSKKFFLIPNGVDVDKFIPVQSISEKKTLRLKLGLPLDIVLILFVGHFSKEKAALDLFKAWEKICDINSFHNSGIIFIGSTSNQNFEVNQDTVNLIHKKSEQYINKNIFFIEKTQKINEYYQASDIYVMPSYREGLPNTLLEAMSSGLPAIASNLPKITDWVIKDRLDGFLYKKGDVGQLTFILKELIENEELRKKIGTKARKNIESRFSILNTTEEIYNVYESFSK